MPRGETLARRWRLEPAPDPARSAALARDLGVPALFASLLAGRGLSDAPAARRFLKPSRDDLCDPALLPDAAPAVERIAGAVRRGETILVHGDYDADGQCAAAIATRVLRMAGARVVPFVPHRLRDGYDLSAAGIAAAREAGAKLILALDCGTTAVQAVADARRAGSDVVIVDHHLPGPEPPPALAFVNPRRPDSAYPFPDLCAAGLAFKLAQLLAPALGLGAGAPWHCLDLVALATVADVVPLAGENRILVRLGLKLMGASRWPGLAALVTTAGLGTAPIRALHLAFVLGPRLNAAGRVGDASDGLRLLLTDDDAEAYRLAAQLERQNGERQALDQRTLAEALDDLGAVFDPARDAGVVLARDGWHPGVVGVVASRVVERIARPAILVAFDGDLGKGSGRSVPGCDLHRALADCAGLLERWGGHRMAGGITLRRERLDAFRDAFNRACAEQVAPGELVPSQRIDAVVSVRDLTLELERALHWLEPTGMGNPGAVFGLENLRLEGAPRPVGTDHVRLLLADGAGRLPVIAFGMREEVERVVAGSGGPFRAAVRLQRDRWQGREEVEGRLVAFEAA
ncbi:MAG TPA: single-stranded-DNA-specific exonuclease RecJ [Gemmatimonadales bacterium]|nr:single-stranded-DNA-specific exonuclease RecJ [Gemmatimonadales bacterium]